MDEPESKKEETETNGALNQDSERIPSNGNNKVISQGTENESNGKDEKIGWPARIQVACTIAIVFITGFYTYYARQQVICTETSIADNKKAINGTIGEMRKQNDALKESIKVALSGVAVSSMGIKAAEKQTRLDQRAWMGVSNVLSNMEAGKPMVVHVSFKNTGKTPAKNVTIAAHAESIPIKSLPDFSKEKRTPQESRGIVPPQGEPTATLNLTGNEKISDNFIEAVNKSIIRVYVHGTMRYEDIFGIKHWLTFCFYLPPNSKAWGAYKEHNDTDNN